jgi:hypothetical protein
MENLINAEMITGERGPSSVAMQYWRRPLYGAQSAIKELGRARDVTARYATVQLRQRVTVKDKAHNRTGHEGPEGEKSYSSILYLTSALDGVGGQSHAPATLPPGKTQYPLYRRLGGPQNRYERLRKISTHQDSTAGPSSP